MCFKGQKDIFKGCVHVQWAAATTSQCIISYLMCSNHDNRRVLNRDFCLLDFGAQLFFFPKKKGVLFEVLWCNLHKNTIHLENIVVSLVRLL